MGEGLVCVCLSVRAALTHRHVHLGFGLSIAHQARLRGVCGGRREAEKREELLQLVLGGLEPDDPKSCPLSCPLQSFSPSPAASQP